MSFSMTLLTFESRDIGLQLLHDKRRPLLKINTICAILRFLWKIPVCNDFLMRVVKCNDIMSFLEKVLVHC